MIPSTKEAIASLHCLDQAAGKALLDRDDHTIVIKAAKALEAFLKDRMQHQEEWQEFMESRAAGDDPEEVSASEVTLRMLEKVEDKEDE